MARIEVDPLSLATVGRRLTDAIDVARQVDEQRSALEGHVADAGDATFAEAVREFLAEWSYGCQCLVEDATTLAEMLTQAGQVYLEVETGVAGAAGGGHG